jgi:hypothetical protein
MAIKNTAYFIQAVRELTNMEDDPVITDDEIRDRCNDGVFWLYDLLIATYEHYSVKTFDFSLTNTLGGNQAVIPSDFYKDVALDLNPTTQPITVHRFSSWVERNNLPRREYIILDQSLVVNPFQIAQGNYRLYYTPVVGQFGAPITVTQTGQTTTPLTVLAFSDRVSGTPPSAVWNFTANEANAPFTYQLLGAALVTSGCDNSDNNGQFTIIDVPDFVQLTTSGTHTDETLSNSVNASYTVFDQIATCVIGNVWSLQAAVLDVSYIGALLTVTGTVSNNGTFTVDKVLSPTTFTVKETTTPEVFPLSVNAIFQIAGTFDLLPPIMAPWYEYIQVYAAIAIKDKIEQDTQDLEVRLERLAGRIRALAANRMEEGGQIAIVNGGGGSFWNNEWPWGGS